MSGAPFRILVFPYQYLADGAALCSLLAKVRRRPLLAGHCRRRRGRRDAVDRGPTGRRRRSRHSFAAAGFPARRHEHDPSHRHLGGFNCGPRVLVCPEYAFGVSCRPPRLAHHAARNIDGSPLKLAWAISGAAAYKTALWPVHYRVTTGRPRSSLYARPGFPRPRRHHRQFATPRRNHRQIRRLTSRVFHDETSAPVR